MKIAEVSKSDVTGGGASRVAQEIAYGLRAEGILSDHWSRFSNCGFDGRTHFPLYGWRTSRLFSKIQRLSARLGYPEFVPVELITLMRHGWHRYDLFHFHDLSGAISPFTLRWLSKHCPVVWTFHDCSPFTAGCLYPMDCERYKNGCGECPQLCKWPLECTVDHTQTLFRLKRKLHATRRVITVAPSSWMAEMAVGSGIVLDPPRVIPNGVDLNIFRPNASRKDAKAFLGINKDRPVVLVAANSISDPRKGAKYSFAAIQAIRDLKPFVIVIGKANADVDSHLLGIDYICTGFISDQEILARWYSLADVFVFCSLADNMPLVILETMACGVPMVGFRAGGIPEMVRQDVSGFLVCQRDQKGLNDTLRRALTNGTAAKWGIESRRIAERDYSMERFISAHKSLYAEVIATFKGCPSEC